MTSKARQNRTTLEERAALLAEWERSGLSQREFSEQRAIPVRTFEYYRRQQLRREGKHGQDRSSGGEAARLVPVRIVPNVATRPASGDGGFTLTLPNGRQIEAGWGFCEAALARLLRVAGQA